MSYDENLAERIRKILSRRRGVAEKKMFGGLAFMLEGNMCCGVIDRDLVARVGPARYEDALSDPRARPMDFTGKPLGGYVYVGPAGCRSDDALKKWLEWSIEFVSTLPAKARRVTKPAKSRKT